MGSQVRVLLRPPQVLENTMFSRAFFMPRMNTPGVFSCLSILLPQAFFGDKANHHLNTPKFHFFSLLTKRVFILSTKLDVDGMPVRCVRFACVRCGRYDCKSRPPNEKGANRAPMFYMFTLHTLSFNRFWV